MLILGCTLALCSCGGPSGEGEQIDTSKTQLYVSNFDGGYGDVWLQDLKAEFEQANAEKSFESGKTGVQVVIDNDKTTGDNLLQRVAGSQNNVYFCESVFYYDYLNAGVMADITDLLNEDLSDLGDTGTILDKFSEQQKDYYRANDGKYYGIPHYEGFFGLTYDISLWEEKDLYIAADPTKSSSKVDALYDEGEIVTAEAGDTKSKGPDGVSGTSDDGFPATYAELNSLMSVMVNRGIIPFTWTGKYQSEYNAKLMAALQVDFEGAEQTKNLFNYSGTLTHMVDSINDGVVTYKAPETIDNSTGYRTFESAGKYYALKFMEQIVINNDFFHQDSFKNTDTHLDAQSRFLASNPIDKTPIAIFPEGNYWENEAADSGFFDYTATAGLEWNRQNRKLAMMPFPKATEEQVGEKTTLLSTLNSLCFINSNCDPVHLDLAKKFLKMANTNSSLANFNMKTNAPKAIKYTLSSAQYDSLNPYGKSVYDLYNRSDVVQEISKNSIYVNNIKDLSLYTTFISKIDGSSFNNVVKEMTPRYTSAAKTSVELFNGIKENFNSNYWQEKYHNWF